MMVLTIHSIHHIFHTSVPYFWYLAFGGVELFFSLSGFLIGKILLDIFEASNFNYKQVFNFWGRRWLRTLPLYFILYFVYLTIYNLLISPQPFDWRYMFFVQNLLSGPPGFFSESWSLSIEEWSYIGFPFLICFILAMATCITPLLKKNDRAFILAVSVVVIVMNIFRTSISSYPGIEDKAVLFRLDAVAYGLAAAYFVRRNAIVSNSKAFYLGIVGLILWTIAAIINITPNPGGLKLLYYPLCGLGTSLLVVAFSYYNFKKRYNAIVYTSKISYSIYLVHITGILIPIGLYTYKLSPPAMLIVLVISLIVVFAVASATYFLIEKPFLRLRTRWFPTGLTKNDKKIFKQFNN